MYKIALNAGHGIGTSGKRCLKSIDPNETREWSLNSRICTKVQEILSGYEGFALIRTDDVSGKTDIPISKRAAAANSFGADVYVSVHHNAGIKGGSGGGIMAFTYLKVDKKTESIQKKLYEKLILKTGLKGNRAAPLAKADFGECRQTKMPAVLLECGFMDSITDTPVILTEVFASRAASAIAESLVEIGGLTRKNEQPAEKPKSDGRLYYVQAGAYSVRENAEKAVNALKAAGFSAVIK